MSLMASAHNRMKKKREKGTNPSNGKTTTSTSIVSPRNNAGKEDVPGGTGNGRGGAAASSNRKKSSPYDVISPKNALSPTNATPSSSAVIATLNGVKKPHYHHVPAIDLPPTQVQQQRGQVPADPPPMQQHVPQHQHQHPPAFHPPRPPIHGNRRAYGGGINSLSLDTSVDYVVESGQPQWPHPQQQRGLSPSPSPRGLSPSPSPDYQTLHHPSPQRLHPLQQPPLNAPPQSPGTFDAATRYQGNYTNYLSPRKPNRVPSRPRRRYDSFTEAPEDAEEEELFRQQQQQQQQQQAFDPFAPSPLTVGGSLGSHGGLINAADVHSAHRASPLFHAAFPRQQLSGSMGNSMGSSGSVGSGNAPYTISMNSGMSGGMHSGGSGGINNGVNGGMGGMHNGGNNNVYAPDYNAAHHRISPQNSDGNQPPMLTTIEGNKLGNFVYDPEASVEQDSRASGPSEQNYIQGRQESEDYHVDDGEIMSANEGSHFFNDDAGGEDAGAGNAATASGSALAYSISPPSGAAASGRSFGSEPPPLVNSYDFEYHTEKDEGSTFDNDGGSAYNSQYEEGRDEIMPLPPSLEQDGKNDDIGSDVYSTNVSTNAVDPRFHRRRSDRGGARPTAGRRAIPPDIPADELPSSFENQTIADRTVDSERALYGTPSKKKKETLKKKRRSHRSRIIIDNVNEAQEESAVDKQYGRSNTESAVGGGGVGGIDGGRDPRYAIHYLEDDHNSLLETPESYEGIHDNGHRHHDDERHHLDGVASQARRDMAAHARRIASRSRSNSLDEMAQGPMDEPARLPPRLPMSSDKGDDPFYPPNSNEVDDTDARFFGPPRIGMSKSWDSHVDDGGGSKQQVGGAPSASFGSFSRNLMWDDDNNGNTRSVGAQQEQDQGSRVMRASKSWDEESNNEMLYPAVNDSIASWGTWGDNTASLFGEAAGPAATSGRTARGGGGGAGSGSAGVGDAQDPFGSDKENLFQQQRQQQQQQQQENDIFQQQDDETNAKALAEWDKAEAEWREKSIVEDVSVEKEDETISSPILNLSNEQQPSILSQPKLGPKKPPPLLSPPKDKKINHHPWTSSTKSKPSKVIGKHDKPPDEVISNGSSMGGDVFSELTGFATNEPSRFSEGVKLPPEEDDDSIFEFDKKGGSLLSGLSGARNPPESAPPAQPQLQSSSSPADIFSKINSSLEMATKTKNRALGLEADLSNDRSEAGDEEQRARDEASLAKVQESPASQMSQGSILSTGSGKNKNKGSGKRIAFAAGAPQVHTYIAPEESSESDKEYTYDDADEDDDTLLDADEEGEGDAGAAETAQQQQQSQKGPRRMSDSPSGIVEDNLREQEGSDNDTYGDSTIGESTYNDPTKGRERNRNGSGGGGSSGGDWHLMEQVDNAVTLVAASLGGLFGVASPTAASASQANTEKSDWSRGSADRSGGGANDARGESSRSLTTEEEEKSIETDVDNDTYGESTVQSTQYTGRTDENSEYDWLGYMRNIIFPREADGGASVVSGRSDALGSRYSGTYDGDDSTYTGGEDEDSYLLQQALAAARAIHHVQGVEYDETQEINVLADIKFVVVTVSLPLGLLFQEHEIGVWVSRVVPDGNGAQKGVQHGDQLAAIDGNSSVHTTIDEVASTISGTPNDVGVELTFLRYVGPLRPVPGSIIQEGFEVTDTSVSPKGGKEDKAAKSGKRSLFSKRKGSNKANSGGGGRSGTPPSSPGTATMASSTRRFAALDLSPKSPNRISRTSPKHATNSSAQSSPRGSSASMASSSKATSKQGSQASAPPMPALQTAGGQPPKQSTKKKKMLGKKLMSFKKK